MRPKPQLLHKNGCIFSQRKMIQKQCLERRRRSGNDRKEAKGRNNNFEIIIGSSCPHSALFLASSRGFGDVSVNFVLPTLQFLKGGLVFKQVFKTSSHLPSYRSNNPT
uniref:Uncharacterized protein n=1 Tax=Mus musculus TaxID=10090 RepID=Q9D5B6_MOUSE|nr:unnamed protein product [Mus musculus]